MDTSSAPVAPTTGPELRSYRRAAEVEAAELSREMGCSRKHVHDIEKWAVVPEEKARAYRAGVETLRRVPVTP